MDIILDSNFFRSDLLLRSKDLEVLLDYLKKSDSNIVMPQIILDEISGLYLRTISDRVTDFNKAAKNVNLSLTDKTLHVDEISVDKEACLKDYIYHIKKRLNISDKKILPYNNDFLPTISKRAINRQKPSGDEGQGFRDTLIWLTILEYAAKTHEKQVAFISNNNSDFGYKDRVSLHESLEKECEALEIKVNYFKDLKEFVVNHSTKIDFITPEWISENISHESLSNLILDQVMRNSSRITSSFERRTGADTTGDVDVKDVNPYNESNISIYEMLDNRLIVNVTVHAEVLVELDYYRRAYYPIYEEYNRELSTESKWLDIEVYLVVTVVNKEVQDYEIDDWDFYDHW